MGRWAQAGKNGWPRATDIHRPAARNRQYRRGCPQALPVNEHEYRAPARAIAPRPLDEAWCI
jgi:hypothetical protein